MRAILVAALTLSACAKPAEKSPTYYADTGLFEFDEMACSLDAGGCPETLCAWDPDGGLVYQRPGVDCARMRSGRQ